MECNCCRRNDGDGSRGARCDRTSTEAFVLCALQVAPSSATAATAAKTTLAQITEGGMFINTCDAAAAAAPVQHRAMFPPGARVACTEASRGDHTPRRNAANQRARAALQLRLPALCCNGARTRKQCTPARGRGRFAPLKQGLGPAISGADHYHFTSSPHQCAERRACPDKPRPLSMAVMTAAVGCR